MRRLIYAGLVVLCCLGFSTLGCSSCFAGEYVLDEDYSASAETGYSSSYWDYIPEDMTFEEWEEWDPTVGELRELMNEASPSEASPSSVGPSPMSLYPDVYDGSISTTQLSYFQGIVRRFSPQMQYVLFRQGRYLYRLVYSEKLEYKNGAFTAPGLDADGAETNYILYNTEYNTVSDGSEGDFKLTPLSYPVYTSLDSKYPELDGGIKNETKTIMFMLAVMFVFNLVSGFFLPGRYRWG